MVSPAARKDSVGGIVFFPVSFLGARAKRDRCRLGAEMDPVIPRFAEKANKPGARAAANLLVLFLPFLEIYGTLLF